MGTESPQPDPLTAALVGLVRDGTLSDQQAQRVDATLRAAGVGAPAGAVPPADERSERSVTAAEVLSYLGAALTIGALVLIVGLSWDELGRAGKITICASATVLLVAVAFAVARWSSSLFRSRTYVVASALGALAAVGAALTAGVAVDIPRGDDLLLPGLALVLVGAGAYAVWRGAPTICAVFAGGLLIVGDLLDRGPDAWDSSLGYGLAFYTYAVLTLALGRLLPQPHVTGVLGGVVALIASEVATVDERPAIGLLLGVVAVAGMFTLFWTARRWWYAALGVLTALIVPPTAVAQIWGDASIAAVVLLAIGVLLVAAALILARRGALRRPT